MAERKRGRKRKPAKRSYGSGFVYVVTDTAGRQYYRAVLELGRDVNGKRQRKTITSRDYATVVQQLEDLRERVASGLVVENVPPTLGHYLEEWLIGREGLRASSIERYRQALHRLPAAMLARPLAEVRPEDLEAAYRGLRERGMAPASVLKVHGVLHTALTRAVQRGYVARNVAALVDAPRLPHTEVQTLSAAQVVALLQAVHGDRYEALYWLACATGMRLGELLALRWQDVDLEAGVVQVCGSVGNARGQGATRQETKSGRMRQVAIPPVVIDVLRRHRARQAAERIGEMVFPSPNGTWLLPGNFGPASWNAVRKRAGLGSIHFHAATRHAAATFLLAGGVPVRIVADILGHSQTSMTLNRYAHVLPGMQAGATALMDQLLRQAAEGKNEPISG